ncbi:MAG TPA: hypothetical protein VN783_09340 [Thermoanaerobaculia bacterium]|nr:hypothetical protein [Thermoanaerobaculia bacterium]
MKNTAKMPMPGALRLRNVHALRAADGSCDLIYDLERGLVLEVPMDLQPHLAFALDRSEPDDELLSFLVREDLLTSDRFAEWPDDESPAASGSWWGPKSEREAHLDLDLAEPDALEALDALFRSGAEGLPVRIRLFWSEGFSGGVESLCRIALEARQRAAANRQPIAFDVVLPLAALEDGAARCLAGEAFFVRLTSGLPAAGSDERADFERRIGRFAKRFDERLTLRLNLGKGDRLRDVWQIAKAAGLQHLDVDWEENAEPRSSAELRHLESDLAAISDDIRLALLDHHAPLDFQPLTRVVGRLLQRLPFDFEREQLAPTTWIGDIDPGSGLRGMKASEVAQLWDGVDELGLEIGDPAPCWNCWARYLCPESRISPSLAEALPPVEERCNFLRARLEAGVRLYHQLAQMDPMAATRQYMELASRVSSEPRRWQFGWFGVV